nr:immunoglobulin heavy chain junction region [Macaca mulatta]MOW93271.1 immunoglobulin heavy chain junction region [Macaca mulatta]MOW93382.1 immunoglobulin heavy chain junction region [Macaca mulatta]MOW93746.1 immunoglobulin heavy chain junction region [Macaca mulatta]MOW94039.1 immunoglobulin heavy chain junction region [Macaca mulatta]
CTTYSLDYW